MGDCMMVNITINEAKARLMNSHPGLYAEIVSGLHDEKIIAKSCAYECNGTVMVKTLWCDSEEFIWYICDINSSDMESALTELKGKENDNLDKILIYARECEGIHCLIFSNTGKPYIDSDIIPLCENDYEHVLSLTTVQDNDDVFTKSISQNLFNDFSDMENDTSICILGIFKDNTLTGAISVKNKNNGEVIVISNILVSEKYRGQGCAPRLIRAALALYPDIRYFYSCGTDNDASIASVKSAGFVFEGTYIFT